jgi:hypothetical protein
MRLTAAYFLTFVCFFSLANATNQEKLTRDSEIVRLVQLNDIGGIKAMNLNEKDVANIEREDGHSILFYLLDSDVENIELLSYLLKNGSDPEKGLGNVNIIYAALEQSRWRIVEELRKYTREETFFNSFNIFAAAYGGGCQYLKDAIKHGVNMHFLDSSNSNVFHYSASGKNSEKVNRLLLNVNHKNKFGITAIDIGLNFD